MLPAGVADDAQAVLSGAAARLVVLAGKLAVLNAQAGGRAALGGALGAKPVARGRTHPHTLSLNQSIV